VAKQFHVLKGISFPNPDGKKDGRDRIIEVHLGPSEDGKAVTVSEADLKNANVKWLLEVGAIEEYTSAVQVPATPAPSPAAAKKEE